MARVFERAVHLTLGDLKAGALDEALTKPPVGLHSTNRCGIAPELKWKHTRTKWKLSKSKAKRADRSGPMSKHTHTHKEPFRRQGASGQ